MTLRQQQPEAVALLDQVQRRAEACVDPGLLAFVRSRVEHLLADGPPPGEPADDRARAVAGVVDQMLLDVASMDDATVRAADAYFVPGGLSDVIVASYAWEARTRLLVASDRLLGGLG
jgi:hypothetical protein